MITTEVENYPGFEEAIMGPELMDVMKKQAARFGTKFIGGDATRVDLRKRPFTIETTEGTLKARALIIATGAEAKWLGLPNEQRLRGHGVSACATCDGFFFRNKVVYVVGGGDSAMEESTFLTKFASRVYVVHRRNELRASKIMQQRALSNPKLEVVWNSVVTDVLGDEQVTGLRLKDVKANEERDVQADGLFLAVGHKPNTDLFKGQLDLDEVGYIKLVGPGTRTSVEGVFAAGDVADRTYRQAVTAAGMGCQAALDAERWLESQE
jgi:thioredoxin reductase (NADPH)